MKKYEVSFEGGEGRYTTKAVNYMLAEDYGYDELKAEILE